jgi:hypothetical protein
VVDVVGSLPLELDMAQPGDDPGFDVVPEVGDRLSGEVAGAVRQIVTGGVGDSEPVARVDAVGNLLLQHLEFRPGLRSRTAEYRRPDPAPVSPRTQRQRPDKTSIRIDWNALKTRPDETAEDAADEASDQIELLNGALIDNDALIDDLVQEGVVITDDEGNITDIVWTTDWEDCVSEYNYGPAPSGKAAYAWAYLCGPNLKTQGPGSPADDSVPLWNWPSENPDLGSPIGFAYDRCHLIAHQLGGTGNS